MDGTSGPDLSRLRTDELEDSLRAITARISALETRVRTHLVDCPSTTEEHRAWALGADA